MVATGEARGDEDIAVLEDAPVVVTATRTKTAPSPTLAPVTIFTRQDIEKAQTDSVPELLRGLPGIDVVQNGGPGTTASVYMRGTNSGHVLVLLNGRKLGSATLGTVSWQKLPVSQIERIEVVRGPRSTLYGSEAIGGVVQIFTRERGAGFNVDAEVGYGNWNTQQSSFSFYGGSDTTNASISIARYYTDGFNAKQTSTAANAANDLDDDGYRNESLSVMVGHRFESGTEVELDLYHAKIRSEYDATSTFDSSNINHSLEQSAGVKLEHDAAPWWRLTVTAGLSRNDSRGFTDLTQDNMFNTDRRTFSLQNDFTVAKNHLITIGGDYMEEEIESSSSYDLSERYDMALFTQYQGSHGKADWVAGIRAIDNEQFGSHYTWDFEAGYRPTDNLRLIAGYGTAFKAPTFNDLYFPASAFGAGNASLQPEESKSFELGAEGRHAEIDWSVRGFYTEIDGLISWTNTTANPFYYTPTNVDNAEITGMELEAGRTIGRFDIKGSLTMMEPKNVTDGTLLNRRSKTTFNTNIGYSFQSHPAHINASVLYQSARFDDAANTYRMGGYTVTDLTGTYDIDESWQIRLKAGNIFDKRYYTTYATATPYNAPGRSIFASMAWRLSH